MCYNIYGFLSYSSVLLWEVDKMNIFWGMTAFWGAAILLFVIVEAATTGLTSIWFALGALAALIASLFGAQLWLQLLWFIIISVAALLVTRPLARKYVNSRRQPTNADRSIGQVATVKERIDNIAGTGAVFVDGKLWTARSQSGEVIEKGTLVLIADIEGVKLIVRPAEAREAEKEEIWDR